MGYLINKMLHKHCLLCMQTKKVFFKKKTNMNASPAHRLSKPADAEFIDWDMNFPSSEIIPLHVWQHSKEIYQHPFPVTSSTIQTQWTQRHQWCSLRYDVQRNRKRDIHHFFFFLFIRFYIWIWPCELNMHFGVNVFTEHGFFIVSFENNNFKVRCHSAGILCPIAVYGQGTPPLTFLHIIRYMTGDLF